MDVRTTQLLSVALLVMLLCASGCSGGGGGGNYSSNGGSADTAAPAPIVAASPNPYPTGTLTALQINDIQPRQLKAGDTCTITGTGFGSERSASPLHTVQFGSAAATVYSLWSDTQIICIVPDGAPGGLVTVTILDLTGSGASTGGSFLVAIETAGSTGTPSPTPSAPIAPSGGTGGSSPAPSPTSQVFISSFGSSGDPSTRALPSTFGAPGLGQLSKPGGIAISPGGTIYVADTGNNRVQTFTAAGGNGIQWGSAGTGDSQFKSPYGIAVDSGNNVYVADTYNNRIQKFNSDGSSLLARWGTLGSGTSQFHWPVAVAADSARNKVYVSDLLNNRVVQFDMYGNSPVASAASTLSWPVGIAVDSSSGNIYVADSGNNRIAVFDSTMALKSSFGTAGSGNGQLTSPYGITIEKASGMIFVADTGNNRIQEFKPDGTFVMAWGSAGSGNNQFASPYSLAAYTDGTNAEKLYIADTSNSRIIMDQFSMNYTAEWSTLVSTDTAGTPWSLAVDATNASIYVGDSYNQGGNTYYVKAYTTAGQYQNRSSGPTGNNSFRASGGVGLGLALDATNRIFVANTTRNRITRGTNITTWTTMTTSPNPATPDSLALDSSGNIYLANTGASNAANRIRKYNSSGTQPTPAPTWSPTPSAGPTDIAVASEGGTYPAVYVVDPGTTKMVRKYTTTDGTAYASSLSIGSGKLVTPVGIGIDTLGYLYVADNGTGAKCIWRFAKDGTCLGKWSSWTSTATDSFNTPNDVCGVMTSSSYNVYVADAGTKHRIVKFQPSYSYVSQFGNYGTAVGEFKYPTGTAVSPDGTRAYVVDRYNNRIQRFDSTSGSYSFANPVSYGTPGSGTNQFSTPFGIALTTSGTTDSLYVTDTGNSRVVVFHCDTGTKAFTAVTSFTGAFSMPTGIAVSPAFPASGYIYVADTGNNCIKVFNSSYILQTPNIGTAGTGTGQFSSPYGVALDSSGNLFFADTGNNRIQRLAKSDGTFTTWGQGGTGNSQFNSPMGLAVNPSGFVYVVDTSNNRVQKFDNNGVWKLNFGTFGNDSQGLNTPFSCAIDGSGCEFVTDTFNHRVQIASPQ